MKDRWFHSPANPRNTASTTEKATADCLQCTDQVKERNIGAYVKASVGNLKPAGPNRSAVEIPEREET